jgi:hypothetical protein
LTTVLFQSGDECHGGMAPSPTLNATIIDGEKSSAQMVVGCKPLVQKDYLDLLSTTLSEFPGLALTAIVIEWLGRKRTMAMEFSVYAFFLFLLFFCLQRYSPDSRYEAFNTSSVFDEYLNEALANLVRQYII